MRPRIWRLPTNCYSNNNNYYYFSPSAVPRRSWSGSKNIVVVCFNDSQRTQLTFDVSTNTIPISIVLNCVYLLFYPHIFHHPLPPPPLVFQELIAHPIRMNGDAVMLLRSVSLFLQHTTTTTTTTAVSSDPVKTNCTIDASCSNVIPLNQCRRSLHALFCSRGILVSR